MLEGKFSDAQIDEVLNAVIQGTGTGRLNLEGTSLFGGTVQGTFYIENGRLVHTDTGTTQYASPVDLFCLREGTFTFASGETTQIKDQSLLVSELILQITAAQDEWNAVRRQIGSMDAVFALRADGATANLILTAAQWEVLVRMDGRTSLRRIAQNLGVSSIIMVKTAVGMLEKGILNEQPVSAAAEPVSEERSEHRGFFDLRRRR